MLDKLYAALDDLRQIEDQIRADGAIAPTHLWIDTQVVGRYKYARLRSDRAHPSCTLRKLRSLGRWGCEDHRDWQRRIQRREALAEIELRRNAIQGVIDRELNPETKLWRPDTEAH